MGGVEGGVEGGELGGGILIDSIVFDICSICASIVVFHDSIDVFQAANVAT